MPAVIKIESAEVTIALPGAAFTTATARLLTADSVTAHNTFEEPERVAPIEYSDIKLDHGGLRLGAGAELSRPGAKLVKPSLSGCLRIE